jgi:hypothetical protein
MPGNEVRFGPFKELLPLPVLELKRSDALRLLLIAARVR